MQQLPPLLWHNQLKLIISRNLNPTTLLMEVHHHSHHPKSWKEYVQEFLMLFFAVFLGFMAEYYLEYRAERHKEHDYLVSMKEDLKADLVEIDRGIMGMEKIKSVGQRLEKLLYKPAWSDNEIDSIYILSLNLSATLIKPNFATGTIDQLKNAGGFRLIKNQEIVHKISAYEKWKQTILLQEESNSHNWRNIHLLQNKLLHVTTLGLPEKLNDIRLDKAELERIQKSTGSKFLTSDKKTLYEYANYIWVQRGYVAYYEIMVKMEQQQAKELIKLIEEELEH